MLYFGVLSRFPWSWGPGTLGCADCSLTPVGTVLSPLPGDSQDFPLHHPHLCPVCDSGEADVQPRAGTWVWGRARVWGAPLPPPASPDP